MLSRASALDLLGAPDTYRMLYAFAHRQLRSDDESKDATQEAVVRVLDSKQLAAGFEDEGHLRAYLFVTLRNLLIRQRLHTAKPVAASAVEPAHEDDVDGHGLAQATSECIEELTEAYRDFALMLIFADVTIEVAARAMELSASTVRNWVPKIRMRLTDCLRTKGYEP